MDILEKNQILPKEHIFTLPHYHITPLPDYPITTLPHYQLPHILTLLYILLTLEYKNFQMK